ncbi:MAG: hypothetical protein JWL76_1474 [Thermoleophilia bacterium]|nr:hypothetical protein [Thermoleophilia bacterium]
MAFVSDLPPLADPLGLLLRGTGAGYLGARDTGPEAAYDVIHEHITHPQRPGNLCFNDWGSYLGELAAMTGAPAHRLAVDVLALDVNENISDMDVAIDVLNYLAVRGDGEARAALVADIVSGQRWHSILDCGTWIDDETVLAARARMVAEPWLLTIDDESPLGRLMNGTANPEVRALLEQCVAVAEKERAGHRQRHERADQSREVATIAELIEAVDANFAERIARDEPRWAASWFSSNPAYMAWRRGKRTDVEELVASSVDASGPVRILAARVAAQLRPDLLLANFNELAGDENTRLRVVRLVAGLDDAAAVEVLDDLVKHGSELERCIAGASRARTGETHALLRAIDLASAADMDTLSEEFNIDLWHDMSSDIAEGMLKVERAQDAELLLPTANDIYREACCAHERSDALDFLIRWAGARDGIFEGLFDASDMVVSTASAHAALDVDEERQRLSTLAGTACRGEEAADAARRRLNVEA